MGVMFGVERYAEHHPHPAPTRQQAAKSAQPAGDSFGV